MVTRTDNGTKSTLFMLIPTIVTLHLDAKNLALIGGISLVAGLGINHLLKKKNGENGTKKDKKEDKEVKIEDLPPLQRRNTLDLDREGMYFLIHNIHSFSTTI